MDPKDWGCHVLDGRFMPIMTDQPAHAHAKNMDSLALIFAENVVVLAAQTHRN